VRSANSARLGDGVSAAIAAGADLIQLDEMDKGGRSQLEIPAILPQAWARRRARVTLQ
jgi:hypothetical protein